MLWLIERNLIDRNISTNNWNFVIVVGPGIAALRYNRYTITSSTSTAGGLALPSVVNVFPKLRGGRTHEPVREPTICIITNDLTVDLLTGVQGVPELLDEPADADGEYDDGEAHQLYRQFEGLWGGAGSIRRRQHGPQSEAHNHQARLT